MFTKLLFLSSLLFSPHLAPLSAMETPRADVVSDKNAENFVNDLIALNPNAADRINHDRDRILQEIAQGGLYLREMDLAHLPESIGTLDHLTKLILGQNQLRSVPESLGNLGRLTWLGLDQNQLRSLPESIGNLGKLTKLSLTDNQLTSLPESISNFGNLTWLGLNHNQLASLPESIGNLGKLTKLSLTDNQLTSLPESFSNLGKLTMLMLDNNPITALPATLGNLQNLGLLHLTSCPILPQGENEQSWGRQELLNRFGDRVTLDDPTKIKPMPANTTPEQVFEELDAEPVRLNRDAFKGLNIPEIPNNIIEDGQEFLEEFAKLLTTLNFSDETRPGYLSYELLAGDYASDGRQDPGTNADKISNHIIPRLTGYFKTLYGLPLDLNEHQGWQMYENNKPALKKALTFIITNITNLPDSEQRAQLFLVFVDGMLHCPTGQKEGIDTVVLSLLGGNVISGDIRDLIKQQLALKKNSHFKTAILAKAAGNSQNVHLITTYEGKLKDVLGLSNVIDYQERMGTYGDDPFNDNPANVLQVYFELLPVQRMVDWVMEKVQTPEESQLSLTLMQMQGSKNTQSKEIAELATRVRTSALFHPLTYQVVEAYLRNNPKVDMSKKNWWQKYLTADPLVAPASLSRKGALQLLIDLGYLIAPAERKEDVASQVVDIDPEDLAAIRFMIDELKSKGKRKGEIRENLQKLGVTEDEIEAAMNLPVTKSNSDADMDEKTNLKRTNPDLEESTIAANLPNDQGGDISKKTYKRPKHS